MRSTLMLMLVMLGFDCQHKSAFLSPLAAAEKKFESVISSYNLLSSF